MIDKSLILILSDKHSSQLSHNFTRFEPVEMSFSNDIVYNQHDNVTLCVGEGYTVAVTVVIWVVLVLIAIATAGGNFLVILAVILVKKLQTPSNILIVSLAFSDFLVGILVLPFNILDVINGYWPLYEGLCDLYISFDVLLCTASILNLCAISIDRYLVITKPLTYINRRTPCMMAQMIAAAWIISALISIPPNFGWKPDFVECKCEYSKNVGYQIYATFCAFYLPLFVMIVLYGRIFKLAREMSRTEQLQMTPSHFEEDLALGTGTDLPAREKDVDVQPVDHLNYEHGNRPQLTHELPTIPEMFCKNNNNIGSPAESTVGLTNGRKSMIRANWKSTKVNSVTFSDGGNSSSFFRMSTGESFRRKSKAGADSKVVKTLGVIMGCFCLCWLPFFLVQLLLAILKASGHDDENLVPLSVFRFLQWLGYINSFLNPLIYAKFNREFRLPFKLILLCQCRNMNARLRSAAFSAQYGLPTGGSRRVSSTNRSVSSRVNRRSLLERTSIQRPQPSATQDRF
ncbi:Serotonergic GPCR [Paragonimus heterotremus]|uniref:Serotonergic GPCR n=1 Tax=Paragonimus heterotremus TaxID=100268 RepID=A0A8J4TF92_9TREM|nr:Serotonergic GPCR [Paragonimus heterotremus]